VIQKTFDTTPEFLQDLLKSLQNGRTQLPDFQRGWVWDDERIRGVLASVSQSFPIGALMLLETGGEARLQPRPVQGVVFPGPEKPEPERLILDGQQRLTSLYQAMMLGEVVETVNARNQKIKRWYYIDMRKAMNSAEDREDAFIGLPENKVSMFQGKVERDLSTPEREYETLCFPVDAIFDSSKWRQAYSKFWQYAPEKMELFDEFEQEVLMRFKQYQIPVITLKREVAKEAVCHVFEKVNTGGMVLNAFELLTATYAADNFNLRDDWYGNAEIGVEGIHPHFVRKKVLRGVANTDFLQVVTLLHTLARREAEVGAGKKPEEATAVSAKRSALLNLPLDGYRQWRDMAVDGFVRASAFLHLEHIYLSRDVPYQTQLVPLAAVLGRLGNRWEEIGIKDKIRQWYWCGVLGEHYGSAVESRFAKDVPELLAWISGKTEASTVRDAVFHPSRLHTLRTRNSAAYKGLYALLMRDGGLDLRTGNPITFQTYQEEKVDIHHIFPRKWCDDMGIETKRRDCVVNKTAISATTNRIIGKHAPSIYLEKLQKRADISDEKMDNVLRSHVIDPAQVRADNFEAFFAAREKALLERIRSAMGKELVEEGPGEEPLGDVLEEEELDETDFVETEAA
jgi:hypothetical protein